MRESSGTTDKAANPDQLFRKQAAEHQAVQQYGTVLLTQPFSYTVLTGWLVLLVILVVGLLFTVDTTRKAQCQGILLPSAGALRVVSLQSGTIIRVHVKDGQRVSKGDALFVLSSERSSMSVHATQEEVTRLLERRGESYGTELQQSRLQARQRIAAARAKKSDLVSESVHLGEQLRLQQARVELAEQSLKRYVDLMDARYISAAQLQDKQAELLDQRQRLIDIRRQQASAKRNELDADANIRDLEIQAQREVEALQRDAATVRQDILENEARREVIVRAPVGGTIAAIAVANGQAVANGTALASVLPMGSPLEAELYATSRAIGFIKPGMHVLLRYQAYPYQKFGQHRAVVSEVSAAAMMPQELESLGVGRQSSEPMYRVRLTLSKQTVRAYGQDVPLKSGMLVEGSVVVDHRKLYEWILEPLFSISGRI